MKRVLLLCIVMIGVQATTHMEYVPAEESECWECHAPGEYNPPMDPVAFAVVKGDNQSAQVLVVNSWLSDIPQYQVSLDLTNAPGVRFAASRDPIIGQTSGGTIQAELATEAQTESGLLSMQPNATFVRLTLEPVNTDATLGPDLTLTVRPQDGIEKVSNSAGRGAVEEVTFTLEELAAIASTKWLVTASMYTISQDPPALTPPGAYPYELKVSTFFNSTQRIRYQTGTDLAPGTIQQFTWDLEQIGNETNQFASDVKAYLYYNHGDITYPDEGWITFAASQLEDAPEIELPTESGESPVFALDEPLLDLVGISEIIGYLAGMSMVFSVTTGGMFGKGSRRLFNKFFGSAKRRIAFHNFLSYGLILFSFIHLILFIVEVNYHWSVGLLWGGIATLCMIGLGFTGALQVPMIRRWGYTTWRNWHFWLAIFALVFTAVHFFLDGRNFEELRSSLNWKDPVVRFFEG